MTESEQETHYRRNPDVDEREMGTALFLATADDTAIYHLNPTGAALWRLLAEPMTLADVVEVLQHAFPDADRAEIADDVTAIISDLERRGLVLLRKE